MVGAYERYRSVEGFEIHAKNFELGLATLFCELEKEPAKQIAFLEGNIDFADQHRTTVRIQWWKERAMTLLAETYYYSGDRDEADRLYAEVRSRLPEKIDHDLAGWCKSWCDRHEARQLMEKGDWEGAYSKILQARLATTKYGRFNLSKGLTMERIVRMSAEIQRHRGNDKEAEEDLEYAQTIAEHTARLRVALEAQLKTMANDAKENGGTGAGQD